MTDYILVMESLGYELVGEYYITRQDGACFEGKKMILGIMISIIIVMIIAVIVYKDLMDKESIDAKVVMIGNVIA